MAIDHTVTLREPTVRRHAVVSAVLATSVAIVLLGLSAPVSAAEPDVVIPYGSDGYRYEVVGHDEGGGFESPDFDDSAWAVGGAPFGSEPGCGFEPATNWPIDTDVLVRRDVELSRPLSSVKIQVAIDNNVRVFWDGELVGSLDHENCAERDSLVVDLPEVGPGTHVLAVRGIDTCCLSVLDIRLTARQVASIIYDAGDGFQVSPDQANPSGPWSYRRTAPNGSHPLLPNFSPNATVCGPSGDGLESWFGPEVLDLPAVSKNSTGADAFPCGAFVPAGALLAHPGGKHMVIIRWTSPMAGSIRVRVDLVDRDDFCGDGVHWSIRVLDQRRIARGNFPNGGSAKVRAEWFSVDQGSSLELKIGPGGSNSCDSTQVRFRVTLLPA